MGEVIDPGRGLPGYVCRYCSAPLYDDDGCYVDSHDYCPEVGLDYRVVRRMLSVWERDWRQRLGDAALVHDQLPDVGYSCLQWPLVVASRDWTGIRTSLGEAGVSEAVMRLADLGSAPPDPGPEQPPAQPPDPAS